MKDLLLKLSGAYYLRKLRKMTKSIKVIKPNNATNYVDVKNTKVPRSKSEIKDLFKKLIVADKNIKEAIKNGETDSLYKHQINLH